MGVVDDAVAALRAGELVVLPTDTVYGLCATPHRADAVRRLNRAKGRDETTPVALVAADVDTLVAWIPELRGRAELAARALLPGPYTLVLPNPARRFSWLAGAAGDTIGVRVPRLAGDAADVVRLAGAVAATSANLHDEPDPRRLADVPPALGDRCAVLLDGGELPGTPSTIVDLTGREPRVLREGAVSAVEAIARAAAALA